MGYREKFFAANPGVNGYYQCNNCGGWFTKQEVDVDHRIPKHQGGTDDLSNLWIMCVHCNRSKGDKVTTGEVAMTLGSSAIQGLQHNGVQGAIQNLGGTLGSIASQQTKNNLNKGLEQVLGKDTGKAVSQLLGLKYKR